MKVRIKTKKGIGYYLYKYRKEREMIKESIFSFLKIRKVPIIIFTGIVVIFGILFYLYDIPFDAIIYGCELSFVWCAVCLFIDFYKYYKRHKLLHINREQFLDDRLRTAGTCRAPRRGQKGRDTCGFPSSLNSYLSLAS